MKSKGTAYLLWFFLGGFGAHKFYLNKVGMGILYIFTGGIFGIGWLVDLFTLGGQVDQYNALYGRGGNMNQQQTQNVVVNVTAPAAAASPVSVSAEKQILALAGNNTSYTLKQIVAKTTLEIEEAEQAISKLVTKGLIKEIASPDGKISYDID